MGIYRMAVFGYGLPGVDRKLYRATDERLVHKDRLSPDSGDVAIETPGSLYREPVSAGIAGCRKGMALQAGETWLEEKIAGAMRS